jgi:hypothetical protein
MTNAIGYVRMRATALLAYVQRSNSHPGIILTVRSTSRDALSRRAPLRATITLPIRTIRLTTA